MKLSNLSLERLAHGLNEPLHTRVRRSLRKIIQSEFQDGEKFYSERHLITVLQVSQPTVRRALSDLVQEGFLEPSARRGFFVRKIAPVRSLGMFHPSSSSGVGNIAFESLSRVCCSSEILQHIYLIHKGETVDRAIRSLRARPVQERIVLFNLTHDLVQNLGIQLEKAGYAHLVLGSAPSGFRGHSISVDVQKEAAIMLDHLLSLGHEEITFLVNEPRELLVTGMRVAALEREIAARKLRNARIVFCETKNWSNSYDAARAKTSEILMQKKRPTALCPLSGVGCWAALRSLMEQGIPVPGKMSLASLDDLPGSALLPVPLTTVTFDLDQRSQRVLDILWGDAPEPVREFQVPYLIVRSSTGPVPRK